MSYGTREIITFVGRAILVFILLAAPATSRAQATPTNAVLRARMLRPIYAPQSEDGLVVQLAPGKSGVAVLAKITNTGDTVASLSNGPASGWTLGVYKVVGGRAEKALRTVVGHEMNMAACGGMVNSTLAIPPGKTREMELRLRKYFVISLPGVYIVRAITQWCSVVGSGAYVRLGTNLIGFTLNPKGKIAWQTRNVTWPKPKPRKVPPGPVLQSSQIPKTGPVAALAQLAGAIKRGDAQTAHHLVYAPSGESHNLAVVDEELAFNRLASALGRRFGANAKARLKPVPPAISPTATQCLLRHLDLKTLKVEGDSAQVRAWAFVYGRLWKWEPNVPLYFRRVKGNWKLADGPNRFPRNSPPRIWDRLTRAQAVIYDSLRHEIEAGKFHSFVDFDAQYRARLAAASKSNSAEMMAYMHGLMRKYHAKMEAERKADMEAFKKAQERDHQVPEGNTNPAAPATQ
ncbi:MAG: hypothetical protein ACP5I8_16250 [Phycisphaerae bacterium]